tara:strand:+ start:3749 stop:4045 length:297 start_codon:yes stop_codon:yes gene_type:complete
MDEEKKILKAEKLKKAREKAKLVREQKKQREMDALKEEVKKEEKEVKEQPIYVSEVDSENEEIITITIKKKVQKKMKNDLNLSGIINWAGNFGNHGSL